MKTQIQKTQIMRHFYYNIKEYNEKIEIFNKYIIFLENSIIYKNDNINNTEFNYRIYDKSMDNIM
jgi:hypothetical protein